MNLRTRSVTGSVADVVGALAASLDARGVQIFATIDHGAGARAAGRELADEQVLIFGNPAVGTTLMQGDPRIGLDLPLRMLVWDDGGQTMVAYHDPSGFPAEYGVELDEPTLTKLSALLESLVADLQ
jgi:uncharacterized protein (DUF302 family)